MNLGLITTEACQNVLPPPDTRCSDPNFALANPDLCPSQPILVIKPGSALTCQLGSIQFRAFVSKGGVETDVTSLTSFASSNMSVAVIGIDSGNATGLSAGQVTISGTYQGMTGSASLTVLAGSNCCQQEHVAILVLLDISKSMSLQFSGSYATRLAYAKATATRFINEVNGNKDSVGLMSFSDAQQNLLSPITGNVASVSATVAGIAQTQDETSFFQAVTQAVAQLNSVTADKRLLLIISDGEDTAATDSDINDPFLVLSQFKTQGGVVMCLGVRSSNVQNGFYRLSTFSTGGFFVNATPANQSQALDFISGLKGYVCAGSCTPKGDLIVNEGQLNYVGFINWNVVGGNVDLLGNGFLDLLPGNGLYVDLGGSVAPFNGLLQSKVPFALVAGHTYRVTIWLAGNQQPDPNDLVCNLQVVSGTQVLLTQSISVTGSSQGFQPFSFAFTAPGNMNATINIQQALAPGFTSVSDPRWGLLLNEVRFEDTGTRVVLFDDTFDTENPVFIPPACGQSTIYPGVYGYYCYGGYGCLSSPLGIQSPDPNPLSDIESGSSTPPQNYTSTKQACASCPAGTGNTSTVTLVPFMTSNTAPAGVAAASSAGIFAQPWMAFDGNLNTITAPVTNWQSAQLGDPNGQWIYYNFANPTVIVDYELFANAPSLLLTMPTDWVWEASNDGSTWTQLDTRSAVVWIQGTVSKRFPTANTTAYLFYRLRIQKTGNFPGYAEPRVIINELRMYGPAPAQACATATATSTISQADADAKATAAALLAAQAMLNCMTAYTSTQQYTATCPAGTCGAPVTRSATEISFVSQHDADLAALAAATAAAQAALNCSACNNTDAISIADAPSPGQVGIADHYPSCACVTGLPGNITKVTVTITGFHHTWPSDIHAILRHPDGTAIYLFGNCGDGLTINGVNITFDDAAAASLPNAGQIVSGTFKPTLYGAQAAFPAPAPVSPGLPQTLSTFIGKAPNGTWSLWLIDARQLNVGGLSGGWSITITSA